MRHAMHHAMQGARGPPTCSSGTSGAGSAQYPRVKRQRVRPVKVPMASGATARASSATCTGARVQGVQGGARGARGCQGVQRRRGTVVRRRGGDEAMGHHDVDDAEAACGGDETQCGEHEGGGGVTLAQHS